MKHQRVVLPPRTDVTSRRRRVAAMAAAHGEDLYERLKSRLLVGVTPSRNRAGGAIACITAHPFLTQRPDPARSGAA
jgi:hypothetical protein